MLRVFERPNGLYLGEPGSMDEVLVKHRKPEDTHPIANQMGLCGGTSSEELYFQILMSHAQERVVDILCGGVPLTVFGREPKSRTPFDYLLGLQDIRVQKQVLLAVGRYGMPMSTYDPGGTEYGLFAKMLDVRPWDFIVRGAISELKTDFTLLFETAVANQLGRNSLGYHNPIIGGYGGGPEGAAVLRIASNILMVPTYQASITGGECINFEYMGSCGRDAVWANSIASQALSRNLGNIFTGQISPTAGPCTDMILYESTVVAMNETTSGASIIFGPRSGLGKLPNHSTGLESRFTGELTRSLCRAGFKRADANEIAKKIMPKYEDKLLDPPRGKPFDECYDPKIIQPSKEWLDIHNKVRKELIDLGVPLE